MTEDQEKDAGLAATSKIIEMDAYLKDLGAVAIRSELHPQWVHVNFPDYATATGDKLFRIRGAIAELLKANAEPSFADTAVEGGYTRSFLPGRVYIHRDSATEALARIAQTQPATKDDETKEADISQIDAAPDMSEEQKSAAKLELRWRGFLSANITDGRF